MLTFKINNNKIVLISNYAWTVYNFRLPLINYLISNGYSVSVITQFDGYEKELKKNLLKKINEISSKNSKLVIVIQRPPIVTEEAQPSIAGNCTHPW